MVGDTVGDPFKDTAGPSLNILIKLMSKVSIVVAGLTVAYCLMMRNLRRMELFGRRGTFIPPAFIRNIGMAR